MLPRRAAAAVAVCLAAAATAAAAPAPPSGLYRYDRGSYAYAPGVPLVRAYGNVFPDALVGLLAEECRNTNEWEKRARDPNLKDSKAATNWAPMRHIEHPRTAAEMAVAVLFRFAFPDGALPAGGILSLIHI